MVTTGRYGGMLLGMRLMLAAVLVIGARVVVLVAPAEITPAGIVIVAGKGRKCSLFEVELRRLSGDGILLLLLLLLEAAGGAARRLLQMRLLLSCRLLLLLLLLLQMLLLLVVMGVRMLLLLLLLLLLLFRVGNLALDVLQQVRVVLLEARMRKLHLVLVEPQATVVDRCDLVETVHVQLANKAGHVVMFVI